MRDLDGGRGHPTARAEDQHALAGTQPGLADQRAPGRLVGQRHSGGFDEREIAGDGV
ncbi:MAG: hypothetical protein U0Z44_14820 [Kouleothrix sp.]